MPRHVLRDRTVVAVLGLLLVGGGLLAVAFGLYLSQYEAPLHPSTPVPSRSQERLVPTATVRDLVAASPSPPPLEAGEVVSLPKNTPMPPTSASALTTIPTAVSTDPSSTMPTATSTDPSRTVPATASADATHALPAATRAPQPTLTANVPPSLLSPRQRIGVVAPRSDVVRYDLAKLGAGWYLMGSTRTDPVQPAGMESARLIVTTGSSYQPEAARLQEIVRHNPGGLWLVGNEPDVIWQGKSTPQEYATVYHDVYELVKAADPTSQVAVGGISTVTPLRLRYLEAVLAAYKQAYGQPMPVDVWNIHLAILREERGAWGVDIPPGLPDDVGVLYEIQDNANVDLLKEQVITFRRWMAEHGLRDKPLIVSEFSVLMPPDYGFPFERVRDFMLDASSFLMTATDDRLGYPADGNRLVQRWAWYSVADDLYYTGNLFDPESGEITPLGQVFAEYASSY